MYIYTMHIVILSLATRLSISRIYWCVNMYMYIYMNSCKYMYIYI